MLSKQAGIRAENHVMAELNSRGIPYLFIDDWYDIEVNEVKVEIKSCMVSVKDGQKNSRRIGRFDFTDPDNRAKQRAENVWVCFVLRCKGSFVTLGFIKACDLPEKRYVCLHAVYDCKLISMDDWLEKVNK